MVQSAYEMLPLNDFKVQYKVQYSLGSVNYPRYRVTM